MDLLLLLQELTLLMQVVAVEVDPIHQLHLVEQVEEEQEVIVDLFGQHQEHTLNGGGGGGGGADTANNPYVTTTMGGYGGSGILVVRYVDLPKLNLQMQKQREEIYHLLQLQ